MPMTPEMRKAALDAGVSFYEFFCCYGSEIGKRPGDMTPDDLATFHEWKAANWPESASGGSGEGDSSGGGR
jgi:hypothetical protein